MLALAAATIAPTAASAQSAHELRRDQRDIAREHREIHRDLARVATIVKPAVTCAICAKRDRISRRLA
jgi:hypothetical protein